MEKKPDRILTPTTLWRVASFGHLMVPATRTHWWDNRARAPHDLVVFQVVLAGKLKFVEGEQSRLLSPGDAFLFRYGEQTAYGLPEPRNYTYVCEWVCLQGAGLGEHWDSYRAMYGSVIVQAIKTPVLGLMRELVDLAQDRSFRPATTTAQAVHRLVMAVFDNAEHRQAQTLKPVDLAVEQILRHPTSAFSIKALADRFGVSREHISRVFGERTGQTPSAYLSKVRMDRALQLLRETDMAIADVASQSGFPNARGFALSFRQAYGMNPTQWRERQRG